MTDDAPPAPRWGLVSAAIGAVVVVMMGALWSAGRVWWCACGSWAPWSSEIWSSHNSQHFVDPYSFTHMLHGVLFYGLLRLLLGADRRGLRLALAALLEAAWEVVENSKWVIDMYRESTISLDYTGDAILNSVGDIGACLAGYAIAAAVPVWVSVAGFALTEIVLAIAIRDSLLLNMLMLVYPIEAVKVWQMAGAPS